MSTREQLLRKFGSPEAVSEYYRSMQKKSMKHPNRQKGVHRGGFNLMSKEELREVSIKGGKASRRGKADN